jgi:hypothetical protein
MDSKPKKGHRYATYDGERQISTSTSAWAAKAKAWEYSGQKTQGMDGGAIHIRQWRGGRWERIV